MVVWEGEAQKGGFGAGTLVTRGHPCPLAPRYRQPSAACALGVNDFSRKQIERQLPLGKHAFQQGAATPVPVMRKLWPLSKSIMKHYTVLDLR
jgi:hypothetical protein